MRWPAAIENSESGRCDASQHWVNLAAAAAMMSTKRSRDRPASDIELSRECPAECAA